VDLVSANLLRLGCILLGERKPAACRAVEAAGGGPPPGPPKRPCHSLTRHCTSLVRPGPEGVLGVSSPALSSLPAGDRELSGSG
jgi:hypothetical protein